jgi:LPXTG-motif cell wall-anchored protein
MRPSRLALLLPLLFSGAGIWFAVPAHAQSQQLPATGTSAEQFALMGGVFLILGGTFVFAPQIVNAVNGFMAAVLRRPRKTPKGQPAAAEAQAAPVVHVLEAHEPPPAHHLPGSQPAEPEQSPWAPEEHVHHQESHGGGVVSRLRDEISTSWSNPREE